MLEKIFEFRETIWRNEPGLVDAQQLNPEDLRDSHDDHGLHWIITAGEAIVAAARVCIHEDATELPYEYGYRHLIADIPRPIASLNRLVVHPSMRRQGLTRPLTLARIEAARLRGAKSMIVEAAPNRIPPLSDLGFKGLGYVADDPRYFVRFTLMHLDISR